MSIICIGMHKESSEIQVRGMAAGRDHTVIVKEDGSVWTCGSNAYDQLGNGGTMDRPIPIKIMTGVKTCMAGGYFTLAINDDGTLWSWGLNTYGQLADGTTTNQPRPVQVNTNVQSAAGGLESQHCAEGRWHRVGRGPEISMASLATVQP